MAKVQTTFTVLDTPARVWAAVSDIERWTVFLPDPAERGWGERWALTGPPERGRVARMLLGPQGRPAQDWALDVWMPGERLVLAKKAQYAPTFNTDASFDITLTPVSDRETRVDAVFEVSFSDPGWSLILNLIVPLKGDLGRFLDHWEKGVLAALAGASQ